MTEEEMFAYAMLAWVALMIGTLLTVAWRLAQGMSTGTAKTPKAVEGRSPASPVPKGCAQPSSPKGSNHDQ